MASDLVRDYTELMLNSPYGQIVYGTEGLPSKVMKSLSSETFTKTEEEDESSEANENTDHLVINDQCRPWTLVVPELEELQDQQQSRTPNNQLLVSGSHYQKEKDDPISSSSYTLASDSSQYSNDVDLWLRGSPTESTGVQNSRVAVVQRSTIAPSSSLDGMWYILAMILPMFSVNNCVQWRCTPSTVLSAAEFFLNQFTRFCQLARTHLRRLAGDQIARDLFATAMDIVLVVYAIGFLVLSLYQASIIG
uniref:SFRICE_032203 n=1 Tax=Spodoptera frugiperda TaxID=7108 RepID=A0A2H1VNQ3_SPOFR